MAPKTAPKMLHAAHRESAGDDQWWPKNGSSGGLANVGIGDNPPVRHYRQLFSGCINLVTTAISRIYTVFQMVVNGWQSGMDAGRYF
jgi:hypothetical protein